MVNYYPKDPNYQTDVKSEPDVLPHAFNLWTTEAEAGGFWVERKLSYVVSSRWTRDTYQVV